MASFTYNSFSGESYWSQWDNYRQKKSFNDDIVESFGKQTLDFSKIISDQKRDFQEAIQNASESQVSAITDATINVCGSLDTGFDLLFDSLQNISKEIGGLRSELNSLASMLDWKLSQLIEYQRLNTILLGNISILLGIPDIQKERRYHVEQGIKFLINATFDHDFFDDSLRNFLEVIKIESTDFFSLHRLGLIYMYSPKFDIEKAEEYFKKAAKYAIAETNSGAIITHNYLEDDIEQSFLDQSPKVDAIKLQAAESYLFAGRCCYIQGKMDSAADYAGKAFSLVPKFVEAGFTQAKALAANNREKVASIVLEKVINTDRFYSLKTIVDNDLCTKQAIQSLLKKLKKESTMQAILLLRNCEAKMIDGSNSIKYLNKIESLINENTYLKSKKAIDLFDEVHERYYCEPNKNLSQTDQFNELVKTINSMMTLQYYKDGIDYKKIDAYFIDSCVNSLTAETQWIFPNSSQIFNNPDWMLEIKSKKLSANVYQFITEEKVLNDNLPNINKKFKDILNQYENENAEYLAFLENERIRVENERIKALNDKIKEIQIEERSRKLANRENLWLSSLVSITGGIIGYLVGSFVGHILGFIFTLFSSSASYVDKVISSTEIVVGIIVGLFGVMLAYVNTRKKI